MQRNQWRPRGVALTIAAVAVTGCGSQSTSPSAASASSGASHTTATTTSPSGTSSSSRASSPSTAKSSPAKTSPTASSTPATEAHYVALGDSYSAGQGAGQYVASSGECRRSEAAYPSLWAAMRHPSSWTFAACSGATTQSVLKNQINQLNPRTTLVSITVGGNDVGFGEALQTCVTDDASACAKFIDAGIQGAQKTLGPKLDAVYSAIHDAAPKARVLVLGYPRLFDRVVAQPEASGKSINNGVKALNAIIKARANAHGFTYIDVDHTFAGHRVGSSSPWLNGLSLSDPAGSFHPNAEGQREAYLAAFDGAVSG